MIELTYDRGGRPRLYRRESKSDTTPPVECSGCEPGAPSMCPDCKELWADVLAEVSP